MLPKLKVFFTRLARIPAWGIIQYLGILVVLTYAYIGFQMRISTAQELQDVRIQVEKLQQDYTLMSESLQARIKVLESITYVDVMNELHKQKNQQK